LLAYVGTVTLSISTVGKTLGPYRDAEPWTTLVGTPAWQLVHGQAPYGNTVVNGYGIAELAGFMVTLHMAIALVSAWLGALGCHCLLAWSPKKRVVP
jgi:hypothetical protein